MRTRLLALLTLAFTVACSSTAPPERAFYLLRPEVPEGTVPIELETLVGLG